MASVTSKNPLVILWAALMTSLNPANFSWTNFVNFANIVVVVLTSMSAQGQIPMGWSLLVVSIITMVLKLVQSHKTIVNTGTSIDPWVYVISLAGVALGAFENWINAGYITEMLGEKWSMWVTIAYSVLLMYIRTGYTNQSLNSKAG